MQAPAHAPFEADAADGCYQACAARVGRSVPPDQDWKDMDKTGPWGRHSVPCPGVGGAFSLGELGRGRSHLGNFSVPAFGRLRGSWLQRGDAECGVKGCLSWKR